jgi:hypothetical protein
VSRQQYVMVPTYDGSWHYLKTAAAQQKFPLFAVTNPTGQNFSAQLRFYNIAFEWGAAFSVARLLQRVIEYRYEEVAG